MPLIVILSQTVAEIFDSVLAGAVLCAFMQYSITDCSLPEVASNIISGSACRRECQSKCPCNLLICNCSRLNLF